MSISYILRFIDPRNSQIASNHQRRKFPTGSLSGKKGITHQIYTHCIFLHIAHISVSSQNHRTCKDTLAHRYYLQLGNILPRTTNNKFHWDRCNKETNTPYMRHWWWERMCQWGNHWHIVWPVHRYNIHFHKHKHNKHLVCRVYHWGIESIHFHCIPSIGNCTWRLWLEFKLNEALGLSQI